MTMTRDRDISRLSIYIRRYIYERTFDSIRPDPAFRHGIGPERQREVSNISNEA